MHTTPFLITLQKESMYPHYNPPFPFPSFPSNLLLTPKEARKKKKQCKPTRPRDSCNSTLPAPGSRPAGSAWPAHPRTNQPTRLHYHHISIPSLSDARKGTVQPFPARSIAVCGGRGGGLGCCCGITARILSAGSESCIRAQSHRARPIRLPSVLAGSTSTLLPPSRKPSRAAV